MLTYRYTAKDQAGSASSGLIEASDEHQAADLLRAKKLLITSLDVKRESNMLGFLNRGNKVSSKQLATTTRQLSTMITAGLPLTKALDVLMEQTKNPALKKALREIVQDIDGGLGLSKSLEKHTNVFPRLYISLVRAGEASGNMDIILSKLADNLETQAEFSSKIKGALIYPVIILIAMSGVMVIIMVFVIPQMNQVYQSLGAELPLSTKILIGISNLFTKQWYILIAIIAGTLFAYKRFALTLRGKYIIADVKAKMPVFGKLGGEVQLTSFIETLGLLISSGVPILDTLDIAKDTLSNIRFQEAAAAVAQQVEKGTTLASAFEKQAVFPPILSQMVAIGEQTGKLDEVLTKVGNSFEEESSNTVKNLATALEPIIMIVLGVSVGFLIFSLILPIYGILAHF